MHIFSVPAFHRESQIPATLQESKVGNISINLPPIMVLGSKCYTGVLNEANGEETFPS